MSNPLQMLEDGILAKDLDLISKAFTALTGRELEAEIAPLVPKASKKKTTSKKAAKPAKAAKAAKAEKVEKTEVSSSVSAKGRKPVMPFNDLTDPDEIKRNKKAAKAKERMREVQGPRQKYVPYMVSCETCKASFDQNKVYPAGMFDSSQRILCENCQIANRPGR